MLSVCVCWFNVFLLFLITRHHNNTMETSFGFRCGFFLKLFSTLAMVQQQQWQQIQAVTGETTTRRTQRQWNVATTSSSQQSSNQPAWLSAGGNRSRMSKLLLYGNEMIANTSRICVCVCVLSWHLCTFRRFCQWLGSFGWLDSWIMCLAFKS